MPAETQTAKNAQRATNQRPPSESTGDPKTDRLIEIVKEAMALIPGTTAEIQALRRYNSEEIEQRFAQAREKLVELLNELTRS